MQNFEVFEVDNNVWTDYNKICIVLPLFDIIIFIQLLSQMHTKYRLMTHDFSKRFYAICVKCVPRQCMDLQRGAATVVLPRFHQGTTRSQLQVVIPSTFCGCWTLFIINIYVDYLSTECILATLFTAIVFFIVFSPECLLSVCTVNFLLGNNCWKFLHSRIVGFDLKRQCFEGSV